MDEKQWEWRELNEGVVFTKESFQLSLMPPRGNLQISGNIEKALRYLDLDLPNLGMEGPAKDDFVLSIGRNRVLVSTRKRLKVKNGWFKEGFIITAADFQWKILALDGPTARMVLAQGVLHPLSSPSCATMVFGKTSFLVKTETGFLLFVEAPYLQYFIDCLESCAIIRAGA